MRHYADCAHQRTLMSVPPPCAEAALLLEIAVERIKQLLDNAGLADCLAIEQDGFDIRHSILEAET